MKIQKSRLGMVTSLIAATSMTTMATAQVVVEQSNSSVNLNQAKEPVTEIMYVNVKNDSGIYVPAIAVKLPSGDTQYIKLGEEGLTREIYFSKGDLAVYVKEKFGLGGTMQVNFTEPATGGSVPNVQEEKKVVVSPCGPFT